MKNERNAGAKPKFKTGTETKLLRTLIPVNTEKKILNSIDEINKDYLFVKTKQSEVLVNYIYKGVKEKAADYLTEEIVEVSNQVEIEYLNVIVVVCDYTVSHDIITPSTTGCDNYAPTGYESRLIVDKIEVEIYNKTGKFLQKQTNEVNKLIQKKINR
jgi:hypothetical protein